MTMEFNKKPVTEIRSHHVFEHFSYVDSFFVLIKWTLALDKGGILMIDVPDICAITNNMCGCDIKREFAVSRLLYGDQASDWAYHKNGWTPNTLEYTLTVLGYIVVEKFNYRHYGENFPNAGVIIKAKKIMEFSKEYLLTQADPILNLYANNNTALFELYQSKLKKKVVKL